MCVAAGSIAVGMLPPTEVFGLELERVDVLSLLRDKSAVTALDDDLFEDVDMEQVLADLDSLTMVEAPDTVVHIARHEWIVEPMAKRKPAPLRSQRVKPTMETVLPFEDFDTLATSQFDAFIEKLVEGRDVRIAFLGDSFVEGDIFTIDMRNEMQQLFGGRGVGFVPCDIPFTTVRRSIKRESSGWSTYSVMKHKSVPEPLCNEFFISGYISEGGAGATTRWETTSNYSMLDSCGRARILLASRDTSHIEVMVNDSLTRTFEVVNNGRLGEIYVEAPVNTLKVKVLDGKTVCYGASFEGDGGVMIDNFSVRSNNGHAIYKMNKDVCADVDELLGYDLVVLQYGLNIMEAERTNYARYGEQLRTMVKYAQAYFPNAAVLILGVSDRWVKDAESGEYKPIGTVENLTSYQRAAADSCGVVFWQTAAAMEALGGMPNFVKNGWAAKDHTHMTFSGGKRLAQALTASIRQRVYERLVEKEEAERLRREALRRAEEERLRREAEAAAIAADADGESTDTVVE